MDAQLEQIREQQKETWNRFSPGWKKWDDFTMTWLKPMGEAIIRSLQLRDDAVVLDVAAGTGEPGLTIATLVGEGRVVITDLADGMLAVAHEKAQKRGISNYETVACDVCELPFEDNTFDAVSCRFGFMFFPNMLLAAQEMVRVLRSDGRVATAVWGTPDKNAWITAIMNTIGKHLQVPAPAPDAPEMFRCGSPGFLADLFRQAGLKNVSEKEITGQLNCGTPENYWRFMNEVAAPVVMAMSKVDDQTKEEIKKQVFALLNQQYSGQKAALDYAAVIVCGEK